METNNESAADKPMRAECEHTDRAPNGAASADANGLDIHIPIGRLLEGKKLKSVRPSDSLEKATTIMMLNDYSQLPVIDGDDKAATEVVSWKSIGFTWASNKQGCLVSDCKYKLQSKQIVPCNTPLLQAVGIIIDMEFVLVNNAQETATIGIVTASDLSEKFKQLTESFLVVREIEGYLRTLVKDIQLPVKRDPKHNNWVPGLDDYCKLFKKRKHWDNLNLRLDQCEFVKALESVKCIRNNVMHFKQPKTSQEHIAELNQFSRCLEQLVSQRSS